MNAIANVAPKLDFGKTDRDRGNCVTERASAPQANASKPQASAKHADYGPCSGFDWNDSSKVINQYQPRTAVYFNEFGQAVVRQEREWDRDEDAIVFFNVETVPALIGALADLLGGDVSTAIATALWRNGH